MDTDSRTPEPTPSKSILHTEPAFSPAKPAAPATPDSETDLEPLPVADSVADAPGAKKITAFGKASRHEDRWSRTPNTTGQGAIHVRTFHSKLTVDALTYMDQVINEWLDAHPQYEVKFVNSTVGIVSGKLKEPNLICQVWV